MKRLLFGLMAFAAGVTFIASPVLSQPPGGRDDKGGKGGPMRFELGQVLPPPLLTELKLTPEQEKELNAIKIDLKSKLDRLLTDEQKKTIENFRPRGPGGPGGPGGTAEKGGRGAGGKKGGTNGPGDKGGKDVPDRPPFEK
jgi:hypothetical protein